MTDRLTTVFPRTTSRTPLRCRGIITHLCSTTITKQSRTVTTTTKREVGEKVIHTW